MRRRLVRYTLVAGVSLAAACGPRPVPDGVDPTGGDASGQASLDAVLALPFRAPSFYDIRGEIADLDEPEDTPPALGLAPLDSADMPARSREIRLYGGLLIFFPRNALVLREVNGRVTGVLYRYWPPAEPPDSGEDDWDIDRQIRWYERGHCEAARAGEHAVGCEVRLARTPDWKAALRLVDSVDAWTIPDESTLRRRSGVIDGWLLKGETRRTGPGVDTGYARWQYHNPHSLGLPESVRAALLLELLDSLAGYGRPSEARRVIRGRYTYGPDTSDVVLCGDSVRAYLRGSLLPVVDFLGGEAIWRARKGPSRTVYLEGVGYDAPRPPRAIGDRVYPSAVDIDAVTRVRWPTPWDCGATP